MDSAIIGLLGAVIGGLAAIIGQTISVWFQRRSQYHDWLRDRRQEAYANAIRYTLRTINKRSELAVEDGKLTAILGKEVTKEWFDDMTEALSWMTTLLAYSSPQEHPRISQAHSRVRDAMLALVKGTDRSLDLDAFSVAFESLSVSIQREKYKP